MMKHWRFTLDPLHVKERGEAWEGVSKALDENGCRQKCATIKSTF